MTKGSFSFRKAVQVFAIVLAAGAFLAACNKNLGESNQVSASGLMVFNLAPDQGAVGVALSGNPLSQVPIAYTGFNGTYQNIYAGQRDVEAYDFLHDSVFAKSSVNFENGNIYSLFVVGNKGVYKNVIARDAVDSSAASDKAYIRYVNAIPDSSAPVVTLVSGGTNVSEAPSAFASVSAFIPVPAGDVSVSAANGSSISASRTFSVENGKVYTALLVGVPGATDSVAKVQVRYVVNGTVPSTTTDK